MSLFAAFRLCAVAFVPGVVHGIVIFLILALILGRTSGVPGATRRLLATLPLSGLLIAAAFYPLAKLVGYLGGLLVTWIATWLALAMLSHWARGRGESLNRALARGSSAAVLSGLAFWTISGFEDGFLRPVGQLRRSRCLLGVRLSARIRYLARRSADDRKALLTR